MKSKYQLFILMVLVIATQEANAAYNYSILVGAHEIGFNTSSSFFENRYETTYSPTWPGIYNLDYTRSDTTLTPPDSYIPFLTVIVRDFKSPMPWTAQVLESETIGEFLPFLPQAKIQVTPNGTFIAGGSYNLFDDNKGEAYGVMVKWPTDQIEVVIAGNLPSSEIWSDISRSFKLVR
jgi:hypothetical protein